MMTRTITNENNNIISYYRPSSTIESIYIVPTVGDASSSSSVIVDVTATSRTSAHAELRRIQGYSSQLLIPEEMILGNDLIKVWNIQDERQVQDSMDITLKEEATFDKMAIIEEPQKGKTMIMEMMDTTKMMKPSLSPLSPTKKIVLDDSVSVSVSFDESESESESEKDSQMECTTTTTTTSGRKRNRRGHQRHQSHFDFSFQSINS
jgi:hypothetical protein